MSNLKPDSVIACLDCPDHVQAVLDASMWAATRLHAPIGLLHATPSQHRKSAIDYSGCLNLDDEHQILDQLTNEEHITNGQLKEQGKVLLNQANQYCEQHLHKLPTYSLHRQETLAESIEYVTATAQLLVIGRQVTCKATLSQLVRYSHCPLLLTYAPFFTPTSALFAFDNRETSHLLLDWLCQSPLVRKLSIHIVMIGKDNTENSDALREAYARLKQAGIDCKKSLIDSRNVTAALIYYQKQHQLDMLISGAFGQSRLREMFQGSDTEKLLDSAKTPYLLFPKA